MFEPKTSHHAADVSLIAFQTIDQIPLDQAKALLNEHTVWAYDKFRELGAPDFDISVHVQRFFAHLTDVLPP